MSLAQLPPSSSWENRSRAPEGRGCTPEPRHAPTMPPPGHSPRFLSPGGGNHSAGPGLPPPRACRSHTPHTWLWPAGHGSPPPARLGQMGQPRAWRAVPRAAVGRGPQQLPPRRGRHELISQCLVKHFEALSGIIMNIIVLFIDSRGVRQEPGDLCPANSITSQR